METAVPPMIRRATTADQDRLVTLLAEAFHTGPVADWLVPDETARRTVFRGYFQTWVVHALRYGIVDITADQAGTAIWYDLSDPIPEPDGSGLRAACGPWWRRFDLLADTFAAQHPAWPHYYLAFLAVDPVRQRRGTGSGLLRYHHSHLVDRGVPAYLEASNVRNRDLYLRHGYRTDGPVHLPAGGPPFWPMHYQPPAPPAVHPPPG